MYDPGTGRFTTPDPLGHAGGENRYAYAANNPATLTDRSGMFLDTLADLGFIGYDVYTLVHDGRRNLGWNLAFLGLDVVGAMIPVATGLGEAARVARAGEHAADAAHAVSNGKQYSAAFEMTLDAADFGRSRIVHNTRASDALREALRSDAAFAEQMDSLIKNVDGAMAARQPPKGWVWHHHPTREGVMQLIPQLHHDDPRL